MRRLLLWMQTCVLSAPHDSYRGLKLGWSRDPSCGQESLEFDGACATPLLPHFLTHIVESCKSLLVLNRTSGAVESRAQQRSDPCCVIRVCTLCIDMHTHRGDPSTIPVRPASLASIPWIDNVRCINHAGTTRQRRPAASSRRGSAS